ncbi:MAG TPA: CDP-alcohol phosphatidyltransferase family protein [Bryobacteraceae bacterium]|jgi:cardiolipin synthase|nr:CDP-alcohol phosphatidyltransferase family protein [Bryobacteraceae bacterium]
MAPWVNVPNLFTLLRLLMAPLVIQAILGGRHVLALALFAAAAFTDYLDGATARRFKSTTQAGAYLDPIADKCLLSGVFLALAAARTVPWWLVAVIFGRDLYILLGAATVMFLTPVRRLPPSVWGKLSTFVQIVTATSWMARDAFPVQALDSFALLTVWPCAAFTLWSGLHYTWRGLRMARAH